MNMKFAFCCAAALSAIGAFADDGVAEESATGSADAAVEEKAVKDQKKDDTKWFFTLPLCRRVQGAGEVLLPGKTQWAPMEEGRFYPLGTSFRAGRENSSIVIAFGKECLVTIENGASFGTRPQKLSEKSRGIVLTGGEVAIALPGNLPAGLFHVTSPGFTAQNLAGESKYAFGDKGDGYEADVRCVTGTLELKGRHFTVPAMHAADLMRIRSSHDDLETILYGKSGDFIVNLDKGIMAVDAVQEDGSVKTVAEPQTLEWHLSVSTRVQINRAVPAIGERMSVTMMTFDSSGTMKNHFAFSEGRPEVNTGELVAKPAAKGEDAKKAAEATNEAAAETTTEAVADEESSEKKDEEKSEAKSEEAEEKSEE